VYNLYFVAYNDAVYVYQPSFPDQILPGEPELILRPPTMAPGQRYGIDPGDPHSITRICLDYLGHEEIILATCDDGDVIGYRIVDIQRALNQQALSSIPDAEHDKGHQVRVLFHRNVGKSAWGLAIHREARMIAISANTREVTVIAFALASPAIASPDANTEGTPSRNPDHSVDLPLLRTSDQIIKLAAGCNVPAVSFNNSGDDLAGRWLFGSCIDGVTRLWDLHNPQTIARRFYLGHCASTKTPYSAPNNAGYCDCIDTRNFPHSVWGAMCLDPRAASDTTNGGSEPLTKGLAQPPFDDMSYQKSRFKVNSYSFLHSDNAFDDENSEMAILEDDSDESTSESTSEFVDSDLATVEYDLFDDQEGHEPEEDANETTNAQLVSNTFDSIFVPGTQILDTETLFDSWGDAVDIFSVHHTQIPASSTTMEHKLKPYCDIRTAPTFEAPVRTKICYVNTSFARFLPCIAVPLPSLTIVPGRNTHRLLQQALRCHGEDVQGGVWHKIQPETTVDFCVAMNR
jgi:hypothetical protein